VRATFVCLLLGCITMYAHAEQARPIEAAFSARPNGEITTRAGDQLRGEFVRLDCHGLSIKYLGNAIVVPLNAIATASSVTKVPVALGSSGDRVSGKLLIRSGEVFVTTQELGKLSFPISALQCERGPSSGQSAARQAPNGGNSSLTREQMSHVVGTGPGPGDTKPEAASNTDAPSAPAESQQPAVQSAPATSGDQKKTPTPKEQQEESERNTLEFLRNEAVLTRPEKIENDLAIGYLHTNSFIGNQKVLVATDVVRYGIATGLEAFLAVPLVYGQRQTFLGGDTISNEVAGLGDVKFGLKYNAVNESVGIPAIVLGITGIAPTGRYPYLRPQGGTTGTTQGGDTRDPLNPLVGTGHWQIIPSVTALKSFDPIVLFGTINYAHFVPATYYGVHVSPGDGFGLNAGFGFAVNDRGTLSSQIFIEYRESWNFNGVIVRQTASTPISARLAYTQVVSTDDLIEPSVIFGLTRDATDAIVQLDWIHRF
jgi:hypothetical protein